MGGIVKTHQLQEKRMEPHLLSLENEMGVTYKLSPGERKVSGWDLQVPLGGTDPMA